MAEPLAAAGHDVVGVDTSAGMLAALGLAQPVHADLVDLDLGRRFDAVLLFSHFVNHADEGAVSAYLSAVRRHLLDRGIAVVERHPPGWVGRAEAAVAERDGVVFDLHDLHRELGRDGEVLQATITYRFDGSEFSQTFRVVDVDDDVLARRAAAAGLQVDRVLDEERKLVVLRPSPAP